MRSRFKTLALTSCAVVALATAAQAQERAKFEISGGDLKTALQTFAGQTSQEVLFSTDVVAGRRTKGVTADTDPQTALIALLDGTGLTYSKTSTGTLLIVKADTSPQSGSAADGGAEVEALIVTAQKREEDIQDVPIAISAFSQRDLEAQKIEGGFDLVKAVPNVTFSKNNFSGYNFSIRGIGTKAISVTTDPGVAVSFNSTTLIRNRLFEQEYFDLERVEVLRGPQGTLFGRNATAGVVNVISAKPDFNDFSGMLKGEVGNYNTKRLSAVVNVPLVRDKLALRITGASTTRDGYGVNLYNNESVDGRNLWSLRATVGFQPADNFRANLIWERFNEDDDRARTSKQLCTRDPGPTHIGTIPLTNQMRGLYTQGCLPGSLYDDAAFGTPNGLAIPFVGALAYMATAGYDVTRDGPFGAADAYIIPQDQDPYGNAEQSHDLRAIYSQLENVYRASADVLELNAEWDWSDVLTFTSQTAYVSDKIYATQDFNRFTTFPVFVNSSNLGNLALFYPDQEVWVRRGDWDFVRSPLQPVLPNGVFCDPQLGCSDTIVGMDLSRAKSRQFSQEFRLQSSFEGPFNFTAGVNYTSYRTTEDYYVFSNGITLTAIAVINGGGLLGQPSDPSKFTLQPDCSATVAGFPDGWACTPIETNPIESIQDTGHNYFLSRNPYKLEAGGLFGEFYWQARDNLKITAGLRLNHDVKTFIPIPSQVLLSDPARVEELVPLYGEFARPFLYGMALYSFAGGAYPALLEEKREWREFTGRLGADWKPDFSFTNETLLYAFYSRGYKAGGLNPPPVGLAYDLAKQYAGVNYGLTAPREFKPEFVNAFEAGTKNTLLQGAMMANVTGFYYDYEGYQVSKIVDRTANNENFDAKVWGLEVEAVVQPAQSLRFNGSIGYLDSELAEGSRSIDPMNRTAGNPNYIVRKPFVTLTSNCVVPVAVEEASLAFGPSILGSTCPGAPVGFGGMFYDPADYPEINYGAGLYTDVSGNELPNSPHWTANLGAQYAMDFLDDWRVTVRGDTYWQSQSWARVYNAANDKLHGWYNVNLSVWFEKPDADLKIELYAKNLLDRTPITDAFLNSDDTALTTNVFVLDPRLIGLSIRKGF